MFINSASISKYNTAFGVSYSRPMIVGLGEIADRFHSMNNFFKKKKCFDLFLKNDCFPENSKVDLSHFFEHKNKYAGYFDIVNNSFPFREIYIHQNPKDNKFYAAIDCFWGRKLLAPIRTKHNFNPIENPEAIHMRFSDLEKMAKGIKKLKCEEFISNIFNMQMPMLKSFFKKIF